MTKKYRKQKVSQTKPISYRVIYSEKSNQDMIGIVFGLVLILVGMNVFFSTRDLRVSIFILIGAFLIVGILGNLRSVVINNDKLIFAYRLTKNIYKASDVKTINWQTGLYYSARGRYRYYRLGGQFPGDLGPSGDLYSQYGRYSFLSVQMKNGKKVEIPGSPYGRFDMQKILVAWQEKYTVPANESTTETD
jgi:hypothetical protein